MEQERHTGRVAIITHTENMNPVAKKRNCDAADSTILPAFNFVSDVTHGCNRIAEV